MSLPIYVKTKGIFDLQDIIKMVHHIDSCSNPLCKFVIVMPSCLEIGGKEGEKIKVTQC